MDDSLTNDTDEGLGPKARQGIKDWDSAFGDWVEDTRVAYDMLAGHQWLEEDLSQMREDKRPAVTMNRLAAMIRGVCGMEVSGRMEARYLAREMGDVQPAEVQNAAAKWVRDECDASDEESEAFRDLVTCGMGWTETRYDTQADPEGKIFIERIDPLDMRWDPLASKKNLSDSRWRARLKRMHLADIKAKWPGKADEITAYLEDDPDPRTTLHVNSPGDDYNGQASRPGADDEVVVIQYQYWVDTMMAKILDPATQQMTEIAMDRLEMVPEAMRPMVLNQYHTRIYRQAIVCGPVTLEDEKLATTGFTLLCMTGVRDRNNGVWYGLVRDLVEPQRWANKFYSSLIDTVATNAKGGVMAETGAVEDPRRFESDWANPRATVWLKPGGSQKITPRPTPNIPPAMAQMMEYAANNLPLISGINLEFLGTTDRNQPGILEYHRKQSVANSLAEFFASMRQYRRNQGRALMEMIYAYIADGRLVRIVGSEGEAYVPLFRQADVQYDVVVDEASSSPDRKMQVWLALEQLIPVALKAGMPIPPEALDYSPLPQPLVQAWKDMIKQQPQVPPQVQQQMDQMQQQMAQLQQENAQLKDTRAEAQAEMALQAQKAQAEMALQAQKTQSEIQLAQEQARSDAQIEQAKAAAAIRLAREKAMLDAAIKEEAAMAQAEGEYTFEREGKRIKSARNKAGQVFMIERDAGGNMIGLRAQTN